MRAPMPRSRADYDRPAYLLANPMPDHADFYDRLPTFEGFASIMDPGQYRALPDDWLIGLTDVVSSTKAIGSGRYKAVNTAGASVIAAVSNALQGRRFPFVFGGDGASFAISGGDAERRVAMLDRSDDERQDKAVDGGDVVPAAGQAA